MQITACTTQLYDVDIFGVSFIHSNSFLGKTLFAYFFINGYQVEDDPGLTMGHTSTTMDPPKPVGYMDATRYTHLLLG